VADPNGYDLRLLGRYLFTVLDCVFDLTQVNVAGVSSGTGNAYDSVAAPYTAWNARAPDCLEHFSASLPFDRSSAFSFSLAFPASGQILMSAVQFARMSVAPRSRAFARTANFLPSERFSVSPVWRTPNATTTESGADCSSSIWNESGSQPTMTADWSVSGGSKTVTVLGAAVGSVVTLIVIHKWRCDRSAFLLEDGRRSRCSGSRFSRPIASRR
jgi:hypothetical protein